MPWAKAPVDILTFIRQLKQTAIDPMIININCRQGVQLKISKGINILLDTNIETASSGRSQPIFRI